MGCAPRVLSDALPHGDEDRGGDEAVLDDEGEEVGRGVLRDVPHEGRPAARVVAREVHHASPDQVVVVWGFKMNTFIARFPTLLLLC